MLWRLLNHCCRHCTGRLLESEDGAVIRCSECGKEVEGPDHKKLCRCGERVGGKNAGLRCIQNPSVTPEIPFEIVVKQVEGVR